MSGARVVETHISILVFAGDRVYKLRKPVRYDFVDFTERVAREADCRREVQLNRRLAPDVYLGVADIVMDGVPLDHMVVMRALPEQRKLAALVAGGTDVERWIDEVATSVAAFHAGARRSPSISAAATPGALGSEWASNFKGVAPFVGPLLDPTAESEIHVHVARWLGRHADLLAERIAQGWVCDGHGDLQAEDIFCLDDGVRILDCIEFSDELRYGDVCADVAFLAMDLERLGRPDAAKRFVAAYERACGEPIPAPLLHHYTAERAYVRAKVACLRHQQGVVGADATARALHTLALRHLRQARQVLLLVGGLPGTGKSTVASAICDQTGWELLRTDEVRAELAPRLGQDRYAPEAVTAVYDEVLRRARRHMEAGSSVVLDASWSRADKRAAAAGAAQEAGVELLELCCSCDEAVAVARIGERRRDGQDSSEATVAVRRAMADRLDPWPSATVLDTSAGTPVGLATCALAALAGAGSAPAAGHGAKEGLWP